MQINYDRCPIEHISAVTNKERQQLYKQKLLNTPIVNFGEQERARIFRCLARQAVDTATPLAKLFFQRNGLCCPRAVENGTSL